MSRNFGEILRYCISRDVTLMFAPIKASKTKSYIFKDTTLYEVIKSTSRKAFSKPGEVPDQDILDALGSALHNCKDWEGGRSTRSKKTIEADNGEQNKQSE